MQSTNRRHAHRLDWYARVECSVPNHLSPIEVSIQQFNIDTIGEIIAQSKILARRYRDLTGCPLGITGEVAEYEAVRLLGMHLAPGSKSRNERGALGMGKFKSIALLVWSRS